MSFPRYPAYKDSGVEWLGAVPSHWDVVPLKRGFSVTLGKMLQPDSSGPDDELLPYLRAANIQWDGVDVSEIKQMWLSPRDREQLALHAGDLLVSEGGDVGRSCVWAGEVDNCSFQNSVNRVRAIGGGSTRFLYYWMSTIKDKGYVDVLCNKSTIAHFTAEKVAAVPIPLPPNAEQRGVAEFLDHETAKIDALVAEQERLIELLQEKRKTVISHAVTKGLDPSVPMKDSGVEWLGEVPAHWTVKRLKNNVRLLTEKTDRRVNPVALENIEGWSGRFIATKTEFEGEGVSFQKGDILFGKLRPYLAKAHLAETDGEAVGDFHVMRPQTGAHARYVQYEILNRSFIDIVDGSTFGSKMPRASWEFVGLMSMPTPPHDEQIVIATFLDQETDKIDALIAEARTVTRLLQERRTALISAAVTGQIDVRGWGVAQR